jgi:hypothetical protein
MSVSRAAIIGCSLLILSLLGVYLSSASIEKVLGQDTLTLLKVSGHDPEERGLRLP